MNEARVNVIMAEGLQAVFPVMSFIEDTVGKTINEWPDDDFVQAVTAGLHTAWVAGMEVGMKTAIIDPESASAVLQDLYEYNPEKTVDQMSRTLEGLVYDLLTRLTEVK